MGMYASFKLARPDILTRLLQDPDELEEYVEETGIGGGSLDPGTALEVEKTWHALHYLLTGKTGTSAPPLDFIIRGGEKFDGREGASAFTAEQVAEIHHALEPLEVDALRARFDKKAMQKARIYPDIWRHPDAEEFLETTLENFETLKAFMQKAANEGFGMILMIS